MEAVPGVEELGEDLGGDRRGRDAAVAAVVDHRDHDDRVAALLGQADIDGALVGGASLEPESFARIIRPEESA